MAYGLWTALLALPLLTGCVERSVFIKSDPPGARVILDGQDVGVTPVEVPYVWYGEREVVLYKDGHRSERRRLPLNAPWWQVFPFDLITDVLLPITLTDRTEVVIPLQPETFDRAWVDEVKRRAAEAREKAHAPDE